MPCKLNRYAPAPLPKPGDVIEVYGNRRDVPTSVEKNFALWYTYLDYIDGKWWLCWSPRSGKKFYFSPRYSKELHNYPFVSKVTYNPKGLLEVLG